MPEECHPPCNGDKSVMCGGSGRNTVYPLPLPRLFVDGDRDPTGRDVCLQDGYSFAGTQYGSQCFCGNSAGKHGKVADGERDMACAGDPNGKCGASYRNTVHRSAPFLGCCSSRC